MKSIRTWFAFPWSFTLMALFLFTLNGCGEKKEKPEKKECEVVVLDWPKSIKDCITAEEEKGIRNGTKKPGDVWKAMIKRCPGVKNDDNNYLLYSLATYPDALTVSSKKEVAEKVKAYAEKNNCCIKKITFAGHGRPGKISTGDGQRTVKCKYINGHPGNAADWKKDLEPLKKLLCKDAQFNMRGCSVGYCSIGAWKMEEIAIFFNVTVVATTVNIKGSVKFEDLKDNQKKTFKPPFAQRTKPEAKCDEDFDKLKEKERKKESETGLDMPFPEPVRSIEFYPGTYDGAIPNILDEPSLIITDQEWIARFTQQIDPELAYDATSESYEKDAVIVIQYESGAYDYAYTTYANSTYGRINDEGTDLMFSLLEEGRQMIQEGIELSMESRN